jgi:hypothetical protein
MNIVIWHTTLNEDSSTAYVSAATTLLVCDFWINWACRIQLQLEDSVFLGMMMHRWVIWSGHCLKNITIPSPSDTLYPRKTESSPHHCKNLKTSMKRTSYKHNFMKYWPRVMTATKCYLQWQSACMPWPNTSTPSMHDWHLSSDPAFLFACITLLCSILNCIWVILKFFKLTFIYNNAYDCKVIMYPCNTDIHT